MIDTDKYEGHTPAPWDSLVCATTGKKWIIDGPEETWGQTIALVEGIGENDVGWINMWLMADAPLLLEEVKRLREQVKDLEYEVENWKGELSVRMHPIDYDALVNGGKKE